MSTHVILKADCIAGPCEVCGEPLEPPVHATWKAEWDREKALAPDREAKITFTHEGCCGCKPASSGPLTRK